MIIRRRTVIILTAAAGWAVLATACGGSDPTRVATARVSLQTVTQMVEASGTITPRAQVSLTAPAAGSVGQLLVADGTQVTAGQPLLRISSPQAQDALTQAQRAAAAAANATPPTLPPTTDVSGSVSGDAKAAIQSVQSGLSSLAQVLSSVDAAQVVQAQAQLDAAQRTVDALTVTAPVSGVVSLRAAPDANPGPPGPGGASTDGLLSIGSPVTDGQTLLTITDTSTLSVSADVGESDVLLLAPGVPADISLAAVPGAHYTGTVTSIDADSTASPAGGVSYRADLALGAGTLPDGSPAPQPKPGMTAAVALRARTAEGAVTVPVSAVVQGGNGTTSVWLVDDGRARRRAVTLGVRGTSADQVTSGLAVGDTVVSRGTGQVSDGQSVP